tara:strand:- start:63 stop:998 length:936 start_codon:yes stop_codon:yes gene_type:complete
MADQSKLEQMLEKLVNNDRDGADSLFHEFVIEKSRSIYEKMLEDEAKDLEVDEATDEEVDEATDEEETNEATDEEVDESSDEEETNEATDEEVDEATDEEVDEASDEEVDEMTDEFAPEADMDATDDMMGDMGADDEADEEGDDDMEDRVVDLEDALDDLKAEFEKMMADKDGDEGDDDDADMDMDDEGDEDKEEAIEVPSELSVQDEMPAFEGKKSEGEQMREYVEKVASPKGEDNKAKSPVAGANNMGGTASNIAAGGEGDTKGSAMSAKEENAGNVNVPGGKASKSMSNAKAAEKSESGADTKSPVGS